MSDRIAGLAWLINFILFIIYYPRNRNLCSYYIDKSWMVTEIRHRKNSLLSLFLLFWVVSLSRAPFLNVFKFMALASNPRNKKGKRKKGKKGKTRG